MAGAAGVVAASGVESGARVAAAVALNAPEQPNPPAEWSGPAGVEEAWRAGWQDGWAAGLNASAAARPSIGPIERALRADLKTLGKDRQKGRAVLVQVALRLARFADRRSDTEGPTTTAKLLQDLRVVMEKVMRLDGDGEPPGDGDTFGSEMSTPVGHTAQP